MPVSAIICEFNPLHNGHKYIMDKTKELSEAAPLVCLMSGNFVQRGEPAIFSKWARTRAALECGADLVLELPSIYAASSAEYFATGAIEILNVSNIIDNLYFGVEYESYHKVEKYVANRMKDENTFYKNARQYMRGGNSYCSAAAISNDPGSNNILAAEYLCALQRSKSSIKAIPVRRQGNEGHNQTATAIRNQLFTSGTFDFDIIPYRAREIFTREIDTGRGPVNENSYENFILGILRLADAKILSELPFVSEGLEFKLVKEAQQCGSLKELIDACTSKRYPRGRIKRIITSLITGVKAAALERYRYTPPYIRALGWNASGRELFKDISKNTNIPAFAQASEGLRILSGPAHEVLENEIRATDIYVLGFIDPQMRKGHMELTEKVVMI